MQVVSPYKIPLVVVVYKFIPVIIPYYVFYVVIAYKIILGVAPYSNYFTKLMIFRCIKTKG